MTENGQTTPPPGKPLETVFQALKESWDRRVVFVGVHLALRIAAFAVITPLLAGIINLAVSLSSQTALTDQDIARFVVSPVGFVVTILLLSMLLVTEILGFSVMTALLRVTSGDRWEAARTAVWTVISHLGSLLKFILNSALCVYLTLGPL